MAKFALYRNGVFVEIRGNLKTKPDDIPRKGVKWYAVDQTSTRAGARPAGFDADTHVMERTAALSNGTHTETWAARALTAQETSDRTAVVAAKSDAERKIDWSLTSTHVAFDLWKRTRVLELLPDFATNKDARTAFKAYWEAAR